MKLTKVSRNNKGVIATTTLIIVAIIIAAVGGGSYVAYDAGYIPINGLLDAKEPVVNNPPSLSDDCTYCDTWLETLKTNVPLKPLVYDMWCVELGAGETADSIISEYTDLLAKEGYKLFTEPSVSAELEFDNPGNITIDNYIMNYGIWIKGFTVVIVLTTHVPDTNLECVLYATGNVLNIKTELEDITSTCEIC